ncbi:MAG: hypothetical protein PHD98_00165 [Bacilli bacterium]|nr:hypothetical protein [Bacilli bacterium]MDD4005569.1 hypothetical protein [Bacilli bacterium]
MRIIVDNHNKYKHFNRQYTVALGLYLGFSLLFIAGILTLFFTSKEDYLVLMIAVIVLTIILVWGTIYFFTNPFRSLRYLRNFYKDLQAGLFDESVLTLKRISEDKAIKRGVELIKVFAVEHLKGQDYEREVYLLEEVENLDFGVLIKVRTFSNIIVSYEVLP